MQLRHRLALALLLPLCGSSFAADQSASPPTRPSPSKLATELLRARRVLFLGDSITADGRYIVYLETWLRARGLRVPELVNLGLPSETCSGLSEPAHPFPRPNVHERLDRALTKYRPDLVFACYGMNDGIYHPFDEARFAAYREGLAILGGKVKKAGAQLVLLTPPAFDPLPLRKKGKLLPAGRDQYAWFEIYENYDEEVIARYARHVLGLHQDLLGTIDLHDPVKRALAKAREKEPDFVLSGDGVHIDRRGHEILARAIAKHWPGLEAEAGVRPPVVDEELYRLVAGRQKLLHETWLGFVGHQRPGRKDGPGLPAMRQGLTRLEAAIAKSTAQTHSPSTRARPPR